MMVYVLEILAKDCEHLFISFYEMHKLYILTIETS